jgi:PIN domain nuclease of toxin-antitoxin system
MQIQLDTQFYLRFLADFRHLSSRNRKLSAEAERVLVSSASILGTAST